MHLRVWEKISTYADTKCFKERETRFFLKTLKNLSTLRKRNIIYPT